MLLHGTNAESSDIAFGICSENCIDLHSCVEKQQKMLLHGTNAVSSDIAFAL